jgi:transcriptional regulator with XRE-family HTH domain
MQRPWVTSPTYETAIRLLAEARREQGVSQRELATRLGKARSFVTKIETRERRLDFVEFVAVARALGLAPGELMARIAAELPEKLEF